MMVKTERRKFTDILINIFGGGTLGALIVAGYIALSVGVVLFLLWIIKLIHQLIVGS